ncbi:LysR family transcriptional regulator [Reichenbachiella sp. 5M10]|uniref:LysR substrate-binding domain-containing protein n=1 Tax=Reichenbachiella sp. 5M10 TaxID=1889772 RepID=UPI000C1470A1|nr:LysR substrate-binding domain-containing protein [Reichenbachiella sp. 5M10]PIB35972.1 LysR family transcriptional regulator [Reichenbachiella sp. 5M10]
MELKHLRLVKTIADEGNIANSSAKLFLTQSALSHQLKEFEERLGFKIFARKRNQWDLTEEGVELYQLANNVLSSIDEKLNQIKNIKHDSGGKIRVSSECYSFYLLFSSFLRDMSLLYPNIEVEFVYDATHQPIPKLLSYDIDLALVTIKSPNQSLSSYEVLQDEVCMLMHKENPLSDKDYIEAADFADLHLLIHSYPLDTVSVYEHFLKPNNVLPQKISDVPLTEVALEMVNADLGVMCIPQWAIQSFSDQKDLVFRPISMHGLKRSIYIVVRNADSTKKHFKDFISTFEECQAG